MSAYDELENLAREIARLKEIQAIMGWDEACMMPPAAGSRRGEALASLQAIIHTHATDPRIGELLDEARAENTVLGEWQRANLRELERDWVEATAVPADLVRALALASSRCEQAWRAARARNDWDAVRPLLEEVVSLCRKRADALADRRGLERYDALLDGFEPGLRVAEIDVLFEDLKAFLLGAIDTIIERRPVPLPIPGPFAVERQQRLCETAMKLLGFDFDRGRFDVSHHPFCGGVPDDTRITTRYSTDGFLESFMGICHETGHALYQQGLPEAWRDQPVGDALGAAVHESQSLLMELQVCRSREFIDAVAPLVREHLGGNASAPEWSGDNLYGHATHVERGLIRVNADEVSYPLHVILRYEIERDLVRDRIEVEDLPDVWDAAMRRYLGLGTGDRFADGCMQDVHWYAGLFGYFPTYTLGALMAAQWFAAVRKDDSSIVAAIGRGDIAPLLGWLRTRVHGQGRRLPMQDLLQEVTGSRLDAEFFKAHIRRRYLDA